MVRLNPFVYYATILFLAFGYFPSANGLTIDKCNHEKLSDSVSKLVSCSGNILDKYLEEFLKEYNTQTKNNNNVFDIAKIKGITEKIYKDLQTCVTDFSKTCFETAVTDLANLFFKAANPIITSEVSIDKLDNLTGLQYVTELVNKFNDTTSGKPEEYLQGLVKSDKNCNIEKIGESIANDDYPGKCFFNQVQFLLPLYEYVDESNKTFPNWISLCQRIDDTMRSCFFESTCISKREMMMIRNVVLKVYQIGMDAALKIKKHFGTVPNMITKMKATTLKYDTESVGLSKVLEDINIKDDSQESRMVKVIDSALDDYKGESCKQKVQALEKNQDRIENILIFFL